MRPYEIKKGSANRLHKKWEAICLDYISQKHITHTKFKQICRTIIRDFDHLPIHEDMKKPRVGIVGEILVKFCLRQTTTSPSCWKKKAPRQSFRI